MNRPIIETLERAVVVEMRKLEIDLARAEQPVNPVALLNIAKQRVAKRRAQAERHIVQLVNRPFAELLK